ncbi:MAG: S8 family serine peptidase [Frankiaceae bacterium]|nr:S8 family serine peptidase [Frankiaceae bacterium]
MQITRDWAFDGADGQGVDVAVVDSGIDPTHPAVGPVSSAVALTWDPLAEQVIAADGPHTDLFGHGTACAGIIRAVAPQCRLHSVRVLGERLSGKGPVFAHGLRHAMTIARVVNLSLSTSRPEYRTLFYEIADEAAFRGVVLVCAVNNAPAPSYPSQFASVVSVAANDGAGPYDLDCNPTPPVEFGAPGIGVTVPWLNGGSIVTTGNSYAAPHVAGLVARLLSKHPTLTPYEVKTVLRHVSRNAQRG